MRAHHERAQCGRCAHRHEQRQPDGEQKSDRQRPKERALQAREHENRQKRHSHRGGGVEHGPAHFEGRAHNQLTNVDAMRRAAASSHDVLDINHRIIHDDAQGYDEAAQGHRVERDPKAREDPNRRQERDRNRAE